MLLGTLELMLLNRLCNYFQSQIDSWYVMNRYIVFRWVLLRFVTVKLLYQFIPHYLHVLWLLFIPCFRAPPVPGMPISTFRTSHMGSQMGSQNTCISSTPGCLFGTRFWTYFGTIIRFHMTSKSLNWILLHDLVLDHLVASKDPKYVAKPRALARVDIYKGDLV